MLHYHNMNGFKGCKKNVNVNVICLPTKHLGARKLIKTCSFTPDLIGIWKCWFLRRALGKQEYPEKNLSEQGREPTTNSTTYDTGTGSRTRATLVGGERSHHCTIHVPQEAKSLTTQKTIAF